MMGASQGSLTVLTQDILDEYTALSYLSKAEILHLYKLFGTLDANGKLQNLNYRFPISALENLFPQLKHNPFKDRIFRVFSSRKDDKFSFEDMLDLCSVMSTNCPDKLKATWAFRLFDFNEDGNVNEEDLMIVIDRLTNTEGSISDEDKSRIIKVLVDEMDLESNGSVGQMEFEHAVGKMSEFSNSFCFRL